MTKPRIHILGGPGIGKSFVAGELSRRLSVPAYDLDDLFWDRSASRYGVRADVDERDRRLAAIVSQDGWVIEGVYYGWLGPSFDAADMIIELYAMVACLSRASGALEAHGAERAEREVKLTKAFCGQSAARIRAILQQFDQNDDELLKSIADDAYEVPTYPFDAVLG